MKPEGSIPNTQGPTKNPHPQPNQSNPRIDTNFHAVSPLLIPTKSSITTDNFLHKVITTSSNILINYLVNRILEFGENHAINHSILHVRF